MSNYNEQNQNKKKRAIFRYFELFYRKFTKLVVFNLMYFAVILPLLCGIIYLICSFFSISSEIVESVFFIRAALLVIKVLPSPVFAILFIISLIAYGPLTAGLTYVSRNIVNEEHVWYSDLFTKAKNNFKQGIVLGLIDVFILLSFLMYLSSDLSALNGSELLFYRIIKIAAILISIVYFCVRFYTYSIAVTFDLKLKDIFKNSLIFCVLGLFNNILALFMVFVITVSFTSTPRIDVVLIGALFFALTRFSVLFATFPIVKKYMLPKKEKDN